MPRYERHVEVGFAPRRPYYANNAQDSASPIDLVLHYMQITRS